MKISSVTSPPRTSITGCGGALGNALSGSTATCLVTYSALGSHTITAKYLGDTNFAIESTGAAKVLLDGNIDDLITDMTGASKLEADELKTKTAEISSTGASHAEVAVSEALSVSITGAGKVIYSGNPPKVEKHISGAGSIRHKD